MKLKKIHTVQICSYIDSDETNHTGFFLEVGARCSSVVREFDHGAMGRRIDPSRSNHCSTTGVCYSVCGMMHIKDP